MKFLLIAFSLCVYQVSFAQNPESGKFWSLRTQRIRVDTLTEKRSTMGWSETPTGETEFVFNEHQVIMSYEGLMGKNYNKMRAYDITSREKIRDSLNYSYYEYYGSDVSNNMVKIGIQVFTDNEYKSAFIYLFQDYSKTTNEYTNVQEFDVIREY